MLAIIASFALLYALIWIFERKKREVDAFEVLVIVVAPAILSGIIRFVCLFVGLAEEWADLIGAVVFAVVTLILLLKPLEFPLKRAAVYTAVVLAINILVSTGLYLVTRKV